MAQEYKCADLESGLARAEEAVEEQTKMGSSRSSGGWKIGLALLAIGLCTAAAVFVVIRDQPKQNVSGGSEEDLSHTLRQISKRHHTGDHQTAIHLLGDKVKDTLKWSDDVSSAFAKGGLTLKNNEIIIPKSGLYFVYSQASFRVDCQVKDAELEGPVYLSHAVKRKSNLFGDERPLLQSIRSSCNRVVSEENGRGWYGTINLGAVFNLEEGDQLSTETSPVGDVLEDSDKTFFGAFAL